MMKMMLKISISLMTLILVFGAKTILAQQNQIEGIGHGSSVESEGLFAGDSIYIYCASGPDDNRRGELVAHSPFVDDSEFKWEKYDTISQMFTDLPNATRIDSVTSRQSRLENGLYRVSITSGGQSAGPFQAWVLHDWITATAEIPDSTSVCEYFKIVASYDYAPLSYFLLDENLKISERKNLRDPKIKFKIRWTTGSEFVASVISPTVVDPPASNRPVEYTLTITDEQFGCTGVFSVDYNSKTTKAEFGYDPKQGEAVLKVTFTNNSINYDSAYWYFYKELDKLKQEILDHPDVVVDSIDFILTDRSPIYEYEWSGNYRVRLTTVKINPTTGNCYNTFYMPKGENIEVDTSDIKLPNVFTPNGDGMNDQYVVFTHSLKKMQVHIYNRWGGLVHSWEYSNIRESDFTHAHSVWDGRIKGGRMASTGVYFVVVSAEGRDGKKKRKEGFVHLFR